MSDSELLWVTVPGGFAGTGAARHAVLRVLVTPKLDGGMLRTNGMEQWPPDALVTAHLTVEFAASPDAPTQPVQVPPPHIQPQAGVWGAFFPASTIITPKRSRSAAAPLVTVDSTSTTFKAIDDTLRAVAATPVGLVQNEVDQATLAGVVRVQLAANWSDDPPPPPPPPPLPPPPAFQPPEFHHTIAMLREHPAVLRALGLIIELTIPVASLPIQAGIVRVGWSDAPTAAPSLPHIVSPWTQFDKMMLPASTTNISAGMVMLADDGAPPPPEPPWRVVTVDVDSAARRLRNAAKTSAAAPYDTAFPLPALRSAGLMLVRVGRQVDFAARRKLADANAQRSLASAQPLTADDLVLGYRIDVKPQDRDWSSASLTKRNATYTVTSSGTQIAIGTPQPALEEGHVKAFAAVDDGSGKLRADEVVARWSGWSLAAPLPSSAPPPPINPGMPFEFRWDFQVPKGTLPRLRFNASYTMRARVADLAGGGLDADDPAAARCFLDVVYQRYEPIASPRLALPQGLDQTGLGPGESIAQVAMREGAEPGTTDLSALSRVMFAPRTSLTMVEQHGFLDQMTPQQIVDLVRAAIGSAPADGPSSSEVLFPDVTADGVCVFPRPEAGGLTVARTDHPWREPWPGLLPKAIVLRPRGEGDNILEWEDPVTDPTFGDRLIVRLAKAEQLTLEVSSSVKDAFRSHFAITAFPGFSSLASVTAGRHPMITPAQAVTFTYAVRRPINDPAGTFAGQRDEGDTYAALTPSVALCGVDPNSTAKLEIAATWTEPDGNGGLAKSFANVPVQTVVINRGDTTLKEIRHEFGDTRRRTITYTATAVSRFRQFFGAAEDPNAFLAQVQLAPAVIRSSARPPHPIVVSARPAFKWKDTVDPLPAFKLVRQRLGGYLRLELDGPWYQTGEGEQLSVIVGTDNNPLAPMWPLLTQVGLDPTRGATNPPPVRFPTAEAFVETAGAPRTMADRDSHNTVVAVPYQPWCRDGRWFADVALPSVAESTFWPFVQLAVARYQPDSVAGLELSAIVRTEMVQLMPPRTLTIRRTGNDVFVALDGPVAGIGTVFPSFEVFLDRLQLPPGVSSDGIDFTALEQPSDRMPVWIADPEPQGGSLGTREFHFVIPPDFGPARVRVAELANITGADGFPGGDMVSVRTEFSDTVLLPQP
jgi:hypothetical protein